MTGTSNRTGFYGQMKLKKRAFRRQTHQMSLVQTGIKKYPMSTVKYTAVSLMLWACFSAGGPEHLVQMHGIMDSIKYQQIKKSKTWMPLLEILYWAVFGSSTRTTIQNKHQNKHKNVSLSTKWIFYHGRPSPLNRREEAPSWSCESEGSGEILDEGMVSDLLSGVL